MIQLIVYTVFLLSCQSDGEPCASGLRAALVSESALQPPAESEREIDPGTQRARPPRSRCRPAEIKETVHPKPSSDHICGS